MSTDTQREFGITETIATIVVLAIIAFAVYSCRRDDTPEEAARKEENRFHMEAMAAVQARLRDPGSADFGAMRVSGKSGARVLCGTVNAKNGFGGYTGDEGFIATPFLVIFRSDAPGDFDGLWEEMC